MPTKYVTAFHAKWITKEKKSGTAYELTLREETRPLNIFCNDFIFKSQGYTMSKNQFAVNTQHVV